MGFIPKFLWGRLNPKYTGPSRAAGTTATVLGDAMQIAQDFDTVVSAMEDAQYQGDEHEANRLRAQAARIYATHRYFSHLVESIPDRRRDQARWEQAYQNLRRASGLEGRSEAEIMPDPRDYSGATITDEDYRQVADAVRTRPDAGTPETRAAYAEATGRARAAAESDTTPDEPPVQTTQRGRDTTFSDGTPLPPEPEDEGTPPDTDTPPQPQTPPDTPSGGGNTPPETPPLPEPPPDDEDLPPDESDVYDPGETPKPKTKRKRVSAGPGRPMKEAGPLTALEQVTGLDKYGSTRVTWRPRFGPFIMNMGRNGPVSLSLAMGPMRYRVWSRRHKRGLSSIDLPGGMSFRGRQISRDK